MELEKAVKILGMVKYVWPRKRHEQSVTFPWGKSQKSWDRSFKCQGSTISFPEHNTYKASDNMVVLWIESKQKEVLILHNTQLSHGIHRYRMLRMPKYI